MPDNRRLSLDVLCNHAVRAIDPLRASNPERDGATAELFFNHLHPITFAEPPCRMADGRQRQLNHVLYWWPSFLEKQTLAAIQEIGRVGTKETINARTNKVYFVPIASIDTQGGGLNRWSQHFSL
jgi:hypothetical protein